MRDSYSPEEQYIDLRSWALKKQRLFSFFVTLLLILLCSQTLAGNWSKKTQARLTQRREEETLKPHSWWEARAWSRGCWLEWKVLIATGARVSKLWQFKSSTATLRARDQQRGRLRKLVVKPENILYNITGNWHIASKCKLPAAQNTGYCNSFITKWQTQSLTISHQYIQEYLAQLF